MKKNIYLLAIIAFLLGNLLPAQAATIDLYKNDVANANKLINAGFEQAGATANSAYGWQDFHDGYQRSNQHLTGNWSIKLSNQNQERLAGAYQRINLNQTKLKPVFIGGYVKGKNIKMKPGSWFGASLYAEIVMTDGTIAYWNSVPNYGTFSWRWIGFNTGTLSSVNKPISHIFIVPILAYASGKAYFDDLTATEFNPTQGAITLMFDDAEKTAYTEAKPVMDQYGFSGTTAVITDYMNLPGYMSVSELQTLQQTGWEIASHGLSHSDLTKMNGRQINKELKRSKYILTSHGFQVNSFVYPYGAYNSDIIARTQKYYRSGRAYELGHNPQGAFNFDVKVRSMINTTTVADVNNWLNDARKNGTWSILTFHSIKTSGDDSYYVTPETFKKIIKVVAASGLPVVTYDQGLNMFAVKQ